MVWNTVPNLMVQRCVNTWTSLVVLQDESRDGLEVWNAYYSVITCTSNHRQNSMSQGTDIGVVCSVHTK